MDGQPLLLRNPVTAWYRRHFADPEVVILAGLLLLGFAVIVGFGAMLAPVLAGLVLAYLLESPVRWLMRLKCPRLLAVVIVFTAFMAVLALIVLGLMPLLYRQLTQLFQQLPTMLTRGQAILLRLPELYPALFTETQVIGMISEIRSHLGGLGQQVLSWSLTSVLSLIALLVYLILLPLLVFFFLKDKTRIHLWLQNYLPRERALAAAVWRDVDQQIGNYVRGKFAEIVIVWAASFLTFAYMGLNFAMLLGVLVGLSVIIPYVGAVVVTIPVALIAYFQWGLTPEFMWLLAAYLAIQAVDGNVLVPVLFSEAVNLHPIAIIVAILLFGGIWGFWGVFFAIPLATLVQAVLKAWPRHGMIPASPQTVSVR